MQASSRSRRRSSRAIWASRRGRHDRARLLPVALGRGAVVGERGQRLADLVEAEADLLGDADERDAPQRRPLVAALAARCAGGVDQALGFVEAQRGRGHAGAIGQRADAQLVVHRRQGTGPTSPSSELECRQGRSNEHGSGGWTVTENGSGMISHITPLAVIRSSSGAGRERVPAAQLVGGRAHQLAVRAEHVARFGVVHERPQSAGVAVGAQVAVGDHGEVEAGGERRERVHAARRRARPQALGRRGTSSSAMTSACLRPASSRGRWQSFPVHSSRRPAQPWRTTQIVTGPIIGGAWVKR